MKVLHRGSAQQEKHIEFRLSTKVAFFFYEASKDIW